MKRVLGTAVLTTLALMVVSMPAQEPVPAQAGTATAADASRPADAAKPGAAESLEEARAITAEGTQPGDTHVRIVRLSEIRGTVVMDRMVGRGGEPTMQNMPITQGMALATGKDGFAEVEFEDGSSLRLAPESEVRFPLLALRSTGAKASIILVDRGMVYVSLEKSKDTEFTLALDKARIAVTPGTHLRLDRTGPKAELSVISGMASVQVVGGAGAAVGKKQTLTFDDKVGGETQVAKGVFEGPYDEWDKDAVNYHQRYMKTSSNAGSTALYGVSDLNYYGGFVDSGCGGNFWQPYFVSAGWSPYSNGMWTLYPSGYSWVSPYPWGWLPFHTGAWSYCPTSGWGWNPGGAWYGLQNVTMLNGGQFGGGGGGGGYTQRSPAHPPGVVGGPRPPRPPAGTKSMVVASSSPIVRSMMDRPDNFVFRRDSAGMGIPRGSLGNLHGISRSVEHHGLANREVYAQPMGPVNSMLARGDHGSLAQHQGVPPMALHRGSMPEGMMQSGGGDRFGWKNGQAGQNSVNSMMRQGNNGNGSFGQRSVGGAQQGSFNRGGGGSSMGGGGGFSHAGGASMGGGGGGGGAGAHSSGGGSSGGAHH